MKRIYVFLNLFLCLSIVSECTNNEVANLLTDPESAKYTLEEDGQSFSVRNSIITLKHTDHTNDVHFVESDTEFNRAVKRNPAILVTGDKPRFAIMRTYPVHRSDPDLIKLGDGRIHIECQGISKWLDEMSDIVTVFHPGRTEYNIKDSTLAGIEFQYVVSQAENWGAIGQLTVSKQSSGRCEVKVKIIYGGLRRCGRTFRAAYFTADETDGLGDDINIVNDVAFIVNHDDDIQDIVAVSFFPSQSVGIENHKVAANFKLSLESGDAKRLYIQAGFAGTKEQLSTNMAHMAPELQMAESKTYYDNLIAPFSISTPNRILDAGFLTAIYNLDYVYAEPAWLEGVHWWNCYWTNLFQISAAISINQTEKARKALQWYNRPESGPASPLYADGSPFNITTGEDGLLYYIYTLHQYFEHTGDVELIHEVWPGVIKALDLIRTNRDPDNNLLLNWQSGCNSFLYQADMLQLTGDAASPSLIYAGSLALAAELASIIGDTHHADEFQKSAQLSLARAQDKLWSPSDGCFYSHVDLQNIKHICHYYTDMVFPVLYTSGPDLMKWQGLEFLKNTLFLESEISHPHTKLQLMRVGDLKSTLFGNDNVMPTQMAEAARAFFALGQNENGYRLLEAVAMAGTIFTEAPGNFPERMSFDGKGEANYNFGNPIGSFLYAVVRGLFGLSLTDRGNTLEWMPGFPSDWDHAEMGLPYAKVNYKKAGNRLIYSVEHPKARGLNFSLFLNPCIIKSVEINGMPVEYVVSAGINRIHLELSAPAELRHQITISYKPLSLELKGPQIAHQNSKQQWVFSQPIEEVIDPQHVLMNIQVDEKEFTAEIGETNSFLSKHQIFVKLKDIPIIYPVDLEVLPQYDITCDTAYYHSQGKQLNLEVSCLAPALHSKAKLLVRIMGNEAEIEFAPSGIKNQILNLSFHNAEMLPEGCYQAIFQLVQNKGIVFEDTASIVLSGIDSTTQSSMTALRDLHTHQIDIAQHLNTNKIIGETKWRHNSELEIKKNLFSEDTTRLSSPVGIFNLSPDKHFIAMVELGRSDPYTCETLPAPFSNSATVYIQQKSSMISLLFVNESQCRNTWAQVGSITLNYNDDKQTIIPLIMGENVEAFDVSFASNTYSVPYENHRDHLNIYRIPCDPTLLINTITIQIDAADFQFGLIGLNSLQPVNN